MKPLQSNYFNFSKVIQFKTILIFCSFFVLPYLSLAQTSDFDATDGLGVSTSGGSLMTGATSLSPSGTNWGNTGNAFVVNDATGVVTTTAQTLASTSTFSFDLQGIGTSTNGLDGSDELTLEISTDNGTSFTTVATVNGNSNSRWSYAGGNAVSTPFSTPVTVAPAGGGVRDDDLDGIESVTITGIPAGDIIARITAENNSPNEYWTIDNLVLAASAVTTEVSFVSATSSISEDGGTIDVCVAITNADGTNATTVEVDLAVAGNTAINGMDYSMITFPTTLTFAAGSSTDECITFSITDDALVEGDETIDLVLQNPAGGNSAALGTGTSHVLTITDDDTPPLPSLVITEIMYNSTGTDDEWIEICNTGAGSENLENLQVHDGSGLKFTFPAASTLASGSCATIALGDNSTAPFNPDCPFTADYGTPASTNMLTNSSENISLRQSDGTTIIDEVTYSSGDGANGNGSSLHVIDVTMNNSVTSTNWQEVTTGGSPGTNSLTSVCAVGATTNVEFVSATSNITENGGTIDVCVAITNPDGTNATTVEVDLGVGGNTATNGTDYTMITFPVTLTFAAGSATNECVTFTITEDMLVEGDETIDLVLQNPAGGNSAALGTSTSHILTINDNDSGITAIGTCTGITAANENTYNITITGLTSSTTYDIDLDGDGVDDVTGVTGVTSFTTTTGIAFVDGTQSQTVQVDADADGSYETMIVVHEVLCTDADDDGDLDFDSGCDEDLAGTDRGYIVATAAPYNGNNVYVYVLTDDSDVAQNVNTSGLFTALASGGNGATDDYNVIAFNFSTNAAAQTFISSLTLGTTVVTTATSPVGCSMACGTMAYNIECRVDDVALQKVVNSGSSTNNLNIGDKVTFDITVFNQGTDPVFDVTVTDYIPAGFDFLTADNSGNAFSGVAANVTGGGTVATTIAGPIASNGMQLIQIVLTVNASATNTNLTNVAEITAALQSSSGSPIMDEDSDLINTEPAVANETDDDINDNPDNPNDEDDSDFAIVTLCSNPVATVNDPVVCEGTTSATLTLTATSGAPDMYTIDYDAAAEAEGFADVTVATNLTGATYVIPMAATPGTYNGVLTYIDPNGCSATDPFTITIEDAPEANAGSDESICADQPSFDLSTSSTPPTASNGTIAWSTSGTGSFSSSTSLTPVYTPSATDFTAGSVVLTITVTTTGTGGCPNASDMMTLTFDTPVTVEAGSSPSSICSTGSVDLTGLGASITGGTTMGTWSTTTGGTFDDGAGAFGTAVSYTPSPAEVAAGEVVFTLTSDDPTGPCTPASDTVTVPISNVSCGTFPWDGN